MKRLLLALCLFLAAAEVRADHSTLHTAATALAPGQSTLITTLGANAAFAGGEAGTTIIEYVNKFTWDPTGKRAYFCGAEHAGGNFKNGCVQYDDATNTWSTFALPPGFCTIAQCDSGQQDGYLFVHGYDHNAFDTTRRVFYAGGGPSGVVRYDTQTATWLAITPPTAFCSLGQLPETTSINYFPDIDRIVLIKGGCDQGGATGTVYYNPATDTWTAGPSGALNTDTHPESAYSKQGFLYHGGGASAPVSLRRLGTTGNWSATLPAAPVWLEVTVNNLVADPASGRILAFPSGSNIRELNMCPTKPCSTATPVWTDTGVASGFAPSGSMIAPISNYGVTMMASHIGGGNIEVRLYKHKTLADGDFISRCDMPGVVFCNGFDVTADLGPEGLYQNKGFLCSNLTTRNCPEIDTTQAASGSGSMRMTIPAGLGAASGYIPEWYANYSTDLSAQFGAGQSFYVQTRQRFTQDYINAGNWKAHLLVTAGDKPGCGPGAINLCFSSCMPTDIVTQSNANWWGYPTWYNGCPDVGQVQIEGAPPANGTITYQNARPSPYCTYEQTVAQTQFPPTGNCFGYFADEWMTFSYEIHLGTRGNGTNPGYNCANNSIPAANKNFCYQNSNFKVRMGRDGQPTEPVIDWTGTMQADDPALDMKYGKFWFNSYTGGEVFPDGGSTWWDEVIVSTQPIPDPGFAGSVTPGDTVSPVVAITTPTTNPTHTISSGGVTIGGTASDDTIVASVTWSNDRGGSGTASGTDNWSFSLVTGSTLIEDNFTGADATAIASHPIAPTNTPATTWTNVGGCGTAESGCTNIAITLVGNKASAVCSGCSEIQRAAAFIDAGSAALTVSMVGRWTTPGSYSNACIMFRYVDVDNHWVACHIYTGVLHIYERVGGVFTLHSGGSAGFTPNVDETISLTLTGNSISTSVNGGATVKHSSASGASLTKVGFNVNSTGDLSATVDDFIVTTYPNNLFTGLNNIEVKAWDAAGNFGVDSLALTLEEDVTGGGSLKRKITRKLQ